VLEGEKPVDLPSSNLHFGVEPSWFVAYPTNDRSRRISPVRRIPAIVSFLNPQPALSLVGGNGSSCP
jgi:hypothetical protein